MDINDIKKVQSKKQVKSALPYDIVLESGKGASVTDKEGKTYIDFASGEGVNVLGYQDTGLQQAIIHQTEKMTHAGNAVYNETVAAFTEKLCDASGYEHVLLTSSGELANEAAIQIVRKYSYENYGPNRHEIITLMGSQHGATMATLSATALPEYHRHFFPFPTGFQYVPVGDGDALANAINEHTCAVMFEPVQSAGVFPQDDEYMQFVDALCKEWHVLLIADETHSGSGRTGSLFACHEFGVHPDIITTAGGLGGGLPLGACLMDRKLQNVLRIPTVGEPLSANPIACAAGFEVLSRLNETFFAQVKEKGAYLQEKLSQMPQVLRVNGMGLMLGISFDGISAKEVAAQCAKVGLLVSAIKNRLVITPPLIISKEELDKGLQILQNVIQ